MPKSSVASILSCLVSSCRSQNLGSHETNYVQYHAWRSYLLVLRKATTNVVRASPVGASDRGSRCTMTEANR